MADSPRYTEPSHKKPKIMTNDVHACTGDNGTSKGQGECCSSVFSSQHNLSTAVGCAESQESLSTNPSHPSSTSYQPANPSLQAGEVRQNDTQLLEQRRQPTSQVLHEATQHTMPQSKYLTSKHVDAPMPSASRANEQKVSSTTQGLPAPTLQIPASSGSSSQLQYSPQAGHVPLKTPPTHQDAVSAHKRPYLQVGNLSTPWKSSFPTDTTRAHHPLQALKPRAQNAHVNGNNARPQPGMSMQQRQQTKSPNDSLQPNGRSKVACQPPAPPRTPKGTIIRLPASRETAKAVGFEKDFKVTNVWGLARWALYHADWAEYLRTGGGDEEAWWLYRKWKGLRGYSVSGFEETFNERLREIQRQGEARKAMARPGNGILGPSPATSGPSMPPGSAYAAQSEQSH